MTNQIFFELLLRVQDLLSRQGQLADPVQYTIVRKLRRNRKCNSISAETYEKLPSVTRNLHCHRAMISATPVGVDVDGTRIQLGKLYCLQTPRYYLEILR